MICRLSFLLSAILMAGVASANALITDLGSPNRFDFQNSATIGYSFTSSAPIEVTSLGMWDDAEDGFNSSVDIGLWTNAGVLLQQVTLPSGEEATLADGFRYVELVTL